MTAATQHLHDIGMHPDQLARWISIAEDLTPSLKETEQSPIALVRMEKAEQHPLAYRAVREHAIEDLSQLQWSDGQSFILDFGEHRTGHLSFLLDWTGAGADAPARLRFVFGEVPSDVAESPYPHQGWLSGAWIADEVINVDFLPQQVRLPRRYAFRYVRVEVIYTSRNFDVVFKDVTAHALTSAGNDSGKPQHYHSPLIERIDEVAVATLRDCMQTSFEDGPRRDQRLWIGDLRLQALVNSVSFKNYDLVKRCLYLFACLPREDGFVTACVYEKPVPRVGQNTIMDYCALYSCSLQEYCASANDLETGHDLWPVAKRQMQLIIQYVNADHVFVEPDNFWVFIDWREGLEKAAAMQGVLIYSLVKTYELAQMLGREEEVKSFPTLISKLREAALRHYYDAEQGYFVGGPKRQISWGANVWLALAEVADKKTAGDALVKVIQDPQAVRPQTPYLYHYMVEALFACDLADQAQALIERYWGGMVEAGADTFWEAYDPREPQTSPYGSKHVNSYCHAWSCTPTWFIRRFLS